MKIKIGIFGSNITRDIFCSKFNDYEEFFEISSSLERVSLISLMNDSAGIEFKDNDIQIYPLNKKNKFRSELLRQDLSKSYLNYFDENIDYLIMDEFFEVFFGIIKINNTYITNNFWDYPDTKFYESVNKNNKLTINDNFIEYYVLWRNSCDKFFEHISRRFPNVKIILNKVKLTSKVLKSDGSYYVDEEFQRCAEIYNPLIKLLENYLETHHDVLIVDCTENVVINENHMRGKGLIHYVDDFYIKSYEKILDLVDKNKLINAEPSKNPNITHDSSIESNLENLNDFKSASLDSKFNEYLQIKKYLFEEASVNNNFIDIGRLRDYLNYISKNDYKNSDIDLQEASFNELIKINRFISENKESFENEIEYLENELNAPYFNENAEYLIKYLESRIDIKNYGSETNNVVLLKSNDSSLNITQPSWFNNNEGIGSVVTGVKGDLDLSFKCINDGKLVIGFKSVDFRDKYGNRVPIYIDYTEILINDEIVVDGSQVSWHDSPFIFEKDVNDGDIININVKWCPINYKSNLFLETDYEKLIDNFYMARIDIKNHGGENNDLTLIDCDDSSSIVFKPDWFKGHDGIGTVVSSSKCDLNLSFRCINDGDLKIDFRAIDFSDRDNNRIPIYIDYHRIEIDGIVIINSSTVLCHDNPLSYTQEVKNGQIVNIKLKWNSLNINSNYQNILSNSKKINDEIKKLKMEIEDLNNENKELKSIKEKFLSSES